MPIKLYFIGRIYHMKKWQNKVLVKKRMCEKTSWNIYFNQSLRVKLEHLHSKKEFYKELSQINVSHIGWHGKV